MWGIQILQLDAKCVPLDYSSEAQTNSTPASRTISTVKLRYNNSRYNNIPRYNKIFSVDQRLFLLINGIRYNNMIR